MGRTSKKIVLSDAEKNQLTSIVKKGTHKSRKITRARVLLLLDSGKDRATIQAESGIDVSHYYRIKRRYFEGGLTLARNLVPCFIFNRNLVPVYVGQTQILIYLLYGYKIQNQGSGQALFYNFFGSLLVFCRFSFI